MLFSSLPYGDPFLRQFVADAFCPGQGRVDQRQPADPAEEHQQNQYRPGDGSQSGRDPHGQSDGADRRGRFKQTGPDGQPLREADDDPSADEQDEIKQQDRRSVPYRAALQPAPEEMRIFLSPEDGDRVGDQNGRRRRFHAAGRRTRRPADQHQPHDHGLSGAAHGREVRRIEAGRSGGHRLKQRGKDPFAHRQPFEFREKEKDGGRNDQHGAGHKDHLALHPVAGKPEPVRPHVLPSQKTDPADHDQQHHGGVEGRLPGVRRQRGKRRVFRSHHVEARVAERGNRVKHRHPHTPDPVFLAETGRQRQRARRLKQKRHFQNEAGQPDDPAHFRRSDRLLHGASLLQRYLSARKQRERRGDGDDAQPADLDHGKNDRLSESGPVSGGVPHNKPRHAHRRGGGEKGVAEGCGRPAF